MRIFFLSVSSHWVAFLRHAHSNACELITYLRYGGVCVERKEEVYTQKKEEKLGTFEREGIVCACGVRVLV